MDDQTGLNIPTFEGSFILGLRQGYGGKTISLEEVKAAIKKVASEISDFVFSGTLITTTIIAQGKGVDYEEPGVLISSSIYPRFPQSRNEFKQKFTEFAGKLAVELKQERTGLKFTDESFLLETKYCKKSDIKKTFVNTKVLPLTRDFNNKEIEEWKKVDR